jgi:hypothetical protein
MTRTLNPRSIPLLVLHLVFVAVGLFLARPTGVAFPRFPFFLGYSLLPCALSWLLFATSQRGLLKQLALRFIAALAVFLTVYLLQLWIMIQYVSHQPEETVEELVSNFYVFTHVFLLRSMGVAVISLLLVALFSRRRGSDHATA